MASTPIYKQKWFIPTLIGVLVLIIGIIAVVLFMRRKKKTTRKVTTSYPTNGIVL